LAIITKIIKEGTIFKNIRVVEVGDGYLTGARGYRFYRYKSSDETWQYIGKISDRKFAFLSNFRILSRLFRADIHFFTTMKNGQSICIAKKGIFKYNLKTGKFEKCFKITRGTRPLNICEDNEGDIFFGEYFNNPERESVNIYKSADHGSTWEVVYTFPAKSIRHIHEIRFDSFTNSIWVATGDLDGECIIGYSDDKFRSFNIVFQGGQEYRTCKLLFFRDKIIYGTDSETAVNYIKQIDRDTLKVTDLVSLQGSVINSVKIGEKCFLSTTVEPSEVNEDKNSYVWMYDNENGECKIVVQYGKDGWDHRYFQFGWCRFPEYTSDNIPFLYFHGNALKKIDGSTVCIKISELRD
jgi:hypothetical protein